MAYKKTEVVKDFEFGQGKDTLRVSKVLSLDEKSVDAVDMRFYYEDDGELKPSKKGVRVDTETLSELIQVLLDFVEVDELEDIDEIIKNKLDDEFVEVK